MHFQHLPLSLQALWSLSGPRKSPQTGAVIYTSIPERAFSLGLRAGESGPNSLKKEQEDEILKERSEEG